MQSFVPSSPAAETALVTLDETRRALVDSARKRFGRIPADALVEHVMTGTRDADFAVREAAVEALLRRWAFAVRDGLVVASRPVGGRVLGAYTTRRSDRGTRGRARPKAREPRPYATVLDGVAPLRGSCDCADYLKSSLGLCKHLLVVIDDVLGNKQRFAAARRELPDRPAFGLVWDPALPLAGSLDRLGGLRLVLVPGATRRLPSRARPYGADTLGELLAAFPRGGPPARVLADLARRRELLALIERALAPGRRIASRLHATPAVRALISEERERADRLAACEAAAPALLAEVRSLRRKLYPYQLEGIERFLRAGRLLLADDMGLGKTTQAIAACHALHGAGRVKRGLVIVPSSLKPQWLREWQDTTHVPVAIVDGAPGERARAYRELRSGFLIMGYEQLLRDAQHVQAVAPEMVVIDEAQRIKNYATKSAVYVKALAPEYRLALTGTPMENRLEELASILDWVDDLALAPKWRLVPWYTAWVGSGAKSGKAGARNLDTLRARLAPCVVRRVRKDVLAQLPPRTDTRVPVAMTPQQIEEHDSLIQPIASLIARSKARPLRQPEFLKLMSLLTQQRIIANGLGQVRFEALWPAYASARPDEALLDGLFAPKLGELRRLISDLVLDQERKVVVFSQWRRMLRLAEWSVRDLLGDAGAGAVFFTGAEKPSQRTRSIVDFHDDPRVRVMFLSDAGGVGLNLQRAANACINLELPWNPAVLEQRIGRIYRIGQKQPIDVYNLVSEYGIESRIASLVGVKQALFSSLFDGTSDEIRFDGAASFLTRVERLVEPGPLPEAPVAVTRDRAPFKDADDADDGAGANDAELAESAVADQLPPAPEPRALPAVVALSNETNGDGARGASLPDVVPTAALFSALRVERTKDGGVRIEAPPEAAGSLVALFEGMAKLIAAATDGRPG